VHDSVKEWLNPSIGAAGLIGSNGHVPSRPVIVEGLLPSGTSYDYE
jgi:hypothetical protein